MKDFMLLLPDEMIVDCLLELSLEDLRNVGATCRRLQDILTSQRKPWSSATDVYRLPLPMGKTFQTVPIDELYWLACRAVTLQKKFAKDVVAPMHNDLQPSRALITRYMSDAQGALCSKRPAGILPGGRVIVVYWMYLIKFYTIDGIVLQPEIVYDGTIQAIEWVSTDNGGRTTLAMVVEAATSKQHILVYDLIYTITDCNTEKLDVKKLAEVDLPSSFGQCYALTLRAPYLVLLGEIGIAILDWVTGRRSQCFLDGGDELQRNLALQRADIHPSRPELILQFSTFLAGIWIETLTIDDLVLPRSTNGDTWNHYIHSANESFTRFSECRIAKVSPISSLVNDTSGTFDMVFSMTRRSDEGPSFCTISLSLADSSLSLKHHGCSSLNHDIASYKTSRGDKALVFRNDYAFFHRVDYYPAKGEYHDHDDLRFIFPPYEVVENIGSRMRDVRLGLPDWCWKCKRRAIVGVDNIYGFALLWTDSGLWVVKY